jgi:hypothetical protein
MDKAKQAKLEAAGWEVGTPEGFLQLPNENEEPMAPPAVRTDTGCPGPRPLTDVHPPGDS